MKNLSLFIRCAALNISTSYASRFVSSVRYQVEVMYALYREIHPPTAVEHCVSCHFLRGSSGEEHNLVTAAASYLRVYRLKKVSGPRITRVC